MGNVLSSCLMLLPAWRIRMFRRGTVISAGLYWTCLFFFSDFKLELLNVVHNVFASFWCLLQGVWKHPNCSLREQGRCEEQAGESKAGYFPQEEEFAVLWDLSQEQLQLWEAFSLPCQKTCWVCTLILSKCNYNFWFLYGFDAINRLLISFYGLQGS